MPILDMNSYWRQDRMWSVVHTEPRVQVAAWVIEPGEESSAGYSVHESQVQLLYLLEGELEAEIGDERATMQAGQLAIVPAGTPHRFTNRGPRPARTLNVYAPPVY